MIEKPEFFCCGNCSQDGKIKEIASEKEFSEGELSRWRNDPEWWKWPIQPTRKQIEKIWKENGVEPTMYDYEEE